MKREKVKNFILGTVAAFGFLLLTGQPIEAENTIPDSGIKYPLELKEATAYTNPHGNLTYSETETIEGITLAGRVEDIGKVAAIYIANDDGSIGEFLGYYTFQDTGYGSNGEIPRGERVDIYMDNYDHAIQFGEKMVYVQIIDGEG